MRKIKKNRKRKIYINSLRQKRKEMKEKNIENLLKKSLNKLK